MLITIFGRPGTTACVRVKQAAEQLAQARNDTTFKYIDMWAEGISAEDVSESAGKNLSTFPQIFIDQKHIGSAEDFMTYARQKLSL